MYIKAMQDSGDYWSSWNTIIDTTGSLTNKPFTIPLYEQDSRGTFSPGNKRLYLHIRYDDGTSWGFNVSFSVDVQNHDANTDTGSLTANLESTVVIGGTVDVSLPAGKTPQDVQVGLMVSSVGWGLWSDYFLPSETWKIRAPAGTSGGSFTIDAYSTDGTRYSKENADSWDGTSTSVNLTVTLAEGDEADW
jgi:hypothetical protein